MLLSIVTLNYKKHQLTLACLASLYEQFSKEFEDDELELVIVDNASPDESVAILTKEIKEKKYKNVLLVPNKENSGFGKGCNIGVDQAKGTYILLLNNDTVVKDRSLLDMLTYMKEHIEVAILGGQLRNVDGSLQASIGSFYTLPKAIMLLAGMQRFGLLDASPKEITKVDWVKGGLLMISKHTFQELNGFDENIFMYTEDMELCYRAHKAGMKIFFYPYVNVLHAEHGSTSKTFAIVNIYKNLLYFYKKHRSVPEYYLLKILLVKKAVLMIILGTLIRNTALVKTYKEALSNI
jgi:GT2 family glycosyltransferase